MNDELHPISLAQVLASDSPLDGELRVQCLANDDARTAQGKPYRKLSLSDGSATVSHSVWSDAHSYTFAAQMQKGACYALTGTFSKSQFGLESKGWGGRMLEGDDRTAVFAGPPALREKQERDWLALTRCVAECPDTPLRYLAQRLLSDHEAAFRRAAAARGNHHARRGGLVEHVSLMAQSAVALCGVYPELRRDLMVTAIVFHDVGKIIENQYEAEGFEMPFSYAAECYGHIAIGVQMAHNLWKTLPERRRRPSAGCSTPSRTASSRITASSNGAARSSRSCPRPPRSISSTTSTPSWR